MKLPGPFGDIFFNKEVRSDESYDILVKKGNQLHRIILVIVGFFSIFYCIYSLLFEDLFQFYLNATLLPSVLISYLLFKKNKTIASKIWNLIHVCFVLAAHSLVRSPETFILAFFFPVFIATLIVFQGKEKKLGYFLTFITLVFFIFLETTSIRIGNYESLSPESLKIEWILNVTGSLLVSILEVIFILLVNNNIQEELIRKRNELIEKNLILENTIKTREKVLSLLSHDLRSPIIVIDTGLEFLASDRADQARKNALITELRKRTKRTISLMDNLLLWSRSQHDQIKYTPEQIDLSDLGFIIKNISQIYTGEKSVHFEFSIPEKGSIVGDKNLLEGLFRNLISNAMKFSLENGIISIEISEYDSHYTLSIKDNGVGMSQETLDKLTKGEFHTTIGTSKEKGHGLGLQLVRDFLQLHNSHLRIESEPGKGSTFSFNLAKA
jgi:signal transduction histidine kinase